MSTLLPPAARTVVRPTPQARTDAPAEAPPAQVEARSALDAVSVDRLPPQGEKALGQTPDDNASLPTQQPGKGGNAVVAYLAAQGQVGSERRDVFSVYEQLVAKNEREGLSDDEAKLFSQTAQAINFVRFRLKEMNISPFNSPTEREAVDAFRQASSAQRLEMAMDAALAQLGPALEAVNRVAGGKPYVVHDELALKKGNMTEAEAGLYKDTAHAINGLIAALQSQQLSGAIDHERFRVAKPMERVQMLEEALRAKLAPEVAELEERLVV